MKDMNINQILKNVVKNKPLKNMLFLDSHKTLCKS